MVDTERGRSFADFFVAALRFFSQFSHFAEHSDFFSVGVQFNQCLQRRFHRIRIRVVAIIEKLDAVDFLDLQTRFGQGSAGETSGRFFKRKTESASGGDREDKYLSMGAMSES